MIISKYRMYLLICFEQVKNNNHFYLVLLYKADVNTFVQRAAVSAAKVTKEAEESAKEKRSSEMGDVSLFFF